MTMAPAGFKHRPDGLILVGLRGFRLNRPLALYLASAPGPSAPQAHRAKPLAADAKKHGRHHYCTKEIANDREAWSTTMRKDASERREYQERSARYQELCLFRHNTPCSDVEVKQDDKA